MIARNCCIGVVGWWSAAVLALSVTVTTPAAGSISFNKDIRPILADRCFACHGPDSAARKAELRRDLEDAAKALLIYQLNPEGLTLLMHLTKEEAGLPLTQTLEAQTELAPAQYQFKHLSFQEGLFAQHLLIQAEAGWSGWEHAQV